MPFLRIVLLSIIAAVTYGILHDQVTARVCVEYFTIGHAPIFATESPTLLAIGWGIIATWIDNVSAVHTGDLRETLLVPTALSMEVSAEAFIVASTHFAPLRFALPARSACW